MFGNISENDLWKYRCLSLDLFLTVFIYSKQLYASFYAKIVIFFFLFFNPLNFLNGLFHHIYFWTVYYHFGHIILWFLTSMVSDNASCWQVWSLTSLSLWQVLMSDKFGGSVNSCLLTMLVSVKFGVSNNSRLWQYWVLWSGNCDSRLGDIHVCYLGIFMFIENFADIDK